MTHEQLLVLLHEDLADSAPPSLVIKAAAASDLRVRLRDLPGGDFCWVVSEPDPRDERKSIWETGLPLQSLPKVTAYFRENSAFDNYLRERTKRAVDYLNQVRTRLGIEMTIEEAMR